MAKTNYLEMLKLQREELDRKNNLVTLSEQYNKMKISKEKEHLQRLYENMNKFEVQKQQELKYRNDIKHSLLHEFFSALMESSTNKFLYKQYTPLITNLIESYISEKGESVILNSFNNKTLFLDESKKKIDSTVQELLDDEKEIKQGTKGQTTGEESEDDTIVYGSMDFDITNKFKRSINSIDLNDIGDAVRTKVNNSVENFLVSNASNKQKIKDTIEKIQSKMDDINNDKVNEFYDMQCKQEINSIRNKPKKSLLEHMVYNTVKSALTDEKLKVIYMDEHGKLNMDRIVEENEVIYTFLEMLNTAKIENVNEKFLENFIG